MSGRNRHIIHTESLGVLQSQVVTLRSVRGEAAFPRVSDRIIGAIKRIPSLSVAVFPGEKIPIVDGFA